MSNYYRYYPNKEDLCLKLIDNNVRNFNNVFSEYMILEHPNDFKVDFDTSNYIHIPTNIRFIYFGDDNEQSIRRNPAYLGKPFFIAKYLCTNNQWGNSRKKVNYPKINFDLKDCIDFCKKNNLSIPSKRHWIGAAQINFNFPIKNMAWYKGNFKFWPSLQQVGKKEPNQNGLYDMFGNVWELCLKEYTENYDNLDQNDFVLLGGDYKTPEKELNKIRPYKDYLEGKIAAYGVRFIKHLI